MKLSELKPFLQRHPAAYVRFLLPNGDTIPAHAHVTEVARIDKRFIDCGGTLRNDTLCRLQTWLADDVDHRLTAGKLARILELAGPVLQSDDLAVDIEHEVGVITQMPLESVEVDGGEIILQLGARHTACLALDRCLPKTVAQPAFDPLTVDFRAPRTTAGCCGGQSSCH